MPYVQFNDQRFPLSAAEFTVGTYEGAALRLPGDVTTQRAVLSVGPDGTGLVRRDSPEALILVNGVPLGAGASPLLHGDRLTIGEHELRYGDDVRSGSTQSHSGVEIPEAFKGRAGGPKKATTDTGGRLVSLVDGREYAVAEGGVTFGREIGNDIVIASTEVSRRHANIAPVDGGYVLTDTSTNGLTVNGVRVENSQRLRRGDVLKIGPEEYRFYADVAPPTEEPREAAPKASPEALPEGRAEEELEAPAETPLTPAPTASAPPPAAVDAPALVVDSGFGLGSLEGLPEIDLTVIDLEDAIVAAAPAAPAASGAPVAPAASEALAPPASPAPVEASRPPLATLVVINEGPIKGTRFEIRTPLANIGRGPHNDVVLHDESVSDSHAKILKREGTWWLADLASTNGTYLAGRRVQGEQQLVGAPDVRFGSVKMMFKSTPVAADDHGTGTRAIASFGLEAARKAAEKKHAAREALQQPEPATVPAEQKKGCMAMITVLVTLGVAGASMSAFLLTTRG